MIVVVLGMHRSGTSVVANVLHHLGVWMGDHLFQANQWNPYGYYEDVDFFDVNVALVHAAGGHWGDPPSAEVIQETGRWFLPQMQQIVTWKARARDVWGWKDPRTSVTMPLWFEAIKRLPIREGNRQLKIRDVRVVRTTRDQDAVVESLARRAREASALAVETGEDDPGLQEMAGWVSERWVALIHEYEGRAARFVAAHPEVRCMTVAFEELVRAETTREIVSRLAAFVEADARLVDGAVEQVVVRG